MRKAELLQIKTKYFTSDCIIQQEDTNITDIK